MSGPISPPGISSNTSIISGAVARTNIVTVDFTATFGAITALTGSTKTQTVTGLLTSDQVHIQCVSAVPSGLLAPNARVSAANTLELSFNTGVAIGITLGSLTFRLTVIR